MTNQSFINLLKTIDVYNTKQSNNHSIDNTSESNSKPQIKSSIEKTTNDPVNHPAHYTYGKIETIDFIEDKGLNFALGNAIKYIVRAGHKNDALEDLQKAAWYINHEIERLKEELHSTSYR